MDTKIILKRLGFEEVHTGGGCTALQKCFSDGTSILITNNGGASIDGMDNGLIVGFENADGEAELQVIVDNPKDIIKFVEEQNRFTQGLEMIFKSKFRVYNFKNYDLDETSDRSGWTGSLWRLGQTAHVARLDNYGRLGTNIDYVVGNSGGEESFLAFCNSLPKYTRKERLDHYGITDKVRHLKVQPPVQIKVECIKVECIFTEELVVDILATKEDQIQKGGE